MTTEYLAYRRARFASRFPTHVLYTPSHFWLGEQEGGRWRVGLTNFALRMLGEPVEVDFEAKPGQPIETGDAVGWLEGFKAVTDLLAPMGGQFGGGNPLLAEEVEAVKADPYDRGWLYLVEGKPGDDCVDAVGYTELLDATIDRMVGKDG